MAVPSRAVGDDDRVVLVPVETDTARIVLVGTGLFALAAVVLLVLRFAAPGWSDGHDQWLWIALAGTVLGTIALPIVGRHRRLGRTR